MVQLRHECTSCGQKDGDLGEHGGSFGFISMDVPCSRAWVPSNVNIVMSECHEDQGALYVTSLGTERNLCTG